MRISTQKVLFETNYTIGIYGIQDIKLSEYSEFVHDHSISVFYKGECVDYLHLERYSRRKFDNRIQDFLYEIFKKTGLSGKKNVDLIFSDNVLGRSMIASNGDIRFEAPISKSIKTDCEEGILRWYGEERKGYVLNHELSHVFSALPFYGEFKDNSLLVHFDGGASKSNLSVWLFKNDKLELLDYGWELEYLSSFYNSNALLFSIIGAKRQEQNSVPGKLMGLAGYGEYDLNIEKWLERNSFFKNIWGKKQVFIEQVKNQFGLEIRQFDTKNRFLQSIVATVQEIFERDFIKKLSQIQENVKADYLYYSGGAALNIVLNSRLYNGKLFKDVFIPPCPGDSGLSLGAAAFLEYKKGNKIERHSPYLNSVFGANNPLDYSLDTIKALSVLLINKKIIGVCNENGEIGPRALGNRSILALANSKDLAKKVSVQCKKREWYRPVAPVMLERNTKYFTGLAKISHLSQYMLLDFNVLKEKQTELGGGTHIDGTSRIQTIFNRGQNPFMYDLLDFLDKEYQIKALINTSFNRKGEPIVNTKEDALISARNMKLDALVLNGKILHLNKAD